jgi:hypothetical protein
LNGEGGVGLFNVGGGIDWWITPHTGMRFEVRDQFVTRASILLGARVGVVFR